MTYRIFLSLTILTAVFTNNVAVTFANEPVRDEGRGSTILNEVDPPKEGDDYKIESIEVFADPTVYRINAFDKDGKNGKSLRYVPDKPSEGDLSKEQFEQLQKAFDTGKLFDFEPEGKKLKITVHN